MEIGDVDGGAHGVEDSIFHHGVLRSESGTMLNISIRNIRNVISNCQGMVLQTVNWGGDLPLSSVKN